MGNQGVKLLHKTSWVVTCPVVFRWLGDDGSPLVPGLRVCQPSVLRRALRQRSDPGQFAWRDEVAKSTGRSFMLRVLHRFDSRQVLLGFSCIYSFLFRLQGYNPAHYKNAYRANCCKCGWQSWLKKPYRVRTPTNDSIPAFRKSLWRSQTVKILRFSFGCNLLIALYAAFPASFFF